MADFPTPRLLPLTIFALGGLLAMKSVTLVRAAAGSPDAPAAATASAAAAANVAPSGAQGTTHGASQGTTHGTTQGTGQATLGTPPGTPANPPPAPAISEGERTVLLELRQRSQALDARDAAVTAREATLAAAELRLNARVSELQALQQKLQDLEKARQEREDASWQGLVKLYESMKPRDAATIFNDLDMNVLLGVVDRMKDAKAATILAAMQPDKAREVTTRLAALRTKRAAVAQSN